jgi:hypothetical protein
MLCGGEPDHHSEATKRQRYEAKTMFSINRPIYSSLILIGQTIDDQYNALNIV